MSRKTPSWCVLGRYKREFGTWSWVGIFAADTAQEALEIALLRHPIHGYYTVLPYEVAARAETGLTFIDSEGSPK